MYVVYIVYMNKDRMITQIVDKMDTGICICKPITNTKAQTYINI